MASDPTYPLFPVFAFCGFVAALIPLPWHFQAWNAGTCIYMLWASLASLVQFVNSIIWHDSMQDVASIWCDISTKFIIGAGVGIPAASLCINRRLYNIASVKAVRVTRQERRRAIYVDIAIAVGLPVLVMALHYIVQGHRFNILEGVGCLPEIYNTPPAYPLVFMWPVLLGCISFVYAALTLRAFWRRRIQFQELLSSSNSALSVHRYFRLMLLSCLEIALTIPLSSYSIYVNTAGLTLSPWISWADTHFNFSHVEAIPALVWRSSRTYTISVEMSRWLYPCCAFIFFALFGFAEEARRNYKKSFWAVVSVFGFKKPSPKFDTLPYVGSPALPKFNASNYASTTNESLPAYTPKDTFATDIEKGTGKDKNSETDISYPSEKSDDSSSYSYPIRFSQLSSSAPSRPISHVIDITIPSSPLGSISESGSSTACTGPPSPYSPYHEHHAI